MVGPGAAAGGGSRSRRRRRWRRRWRRRGVGGGRARRERLGRVWGHCTQTHWSTRAAGRLLPRRPGAGGAGRPGWGRGRAAAGGCGVRELRRGGGRRLGGSRLARSLQREGGAGLLAAIKCGVRRSRRDPARLGLSEPPPRRARAESGTKVHRALPGRGHPHQLETHTAGAVGSPAPPPPAPPGPLRPPSGFSLLGS